MTSLPRTVQEYAALSEEAIHKSRNYDAASRQISVQREATIAVAYATLALAATNAWSYNERKR